MSLPLPPDNPLLPRFRAVLDRNFPSLSLVEDLDKAIPRPIGFYDRHLSSHLTLKRVRIIPSLHENLAKSIIDPLIDFVNKGHTSNYEEYEFNSHKTPQDPMNHATSVALAYDDTFGSEMIHIATKILFTSETPEWIPVTEFVPGNYEPPPGVSFFTEGRLVVNSDGKRIRIQPPFLAPKLPQASRDLVMDLGRVFEWLAHWSFFSHTKRGRSVVSLMPSMNNFNWEFAHTSGVPTARLRTVRPPDADRGFARKEIDNYLQGRRKTAEKADLSFMQSKKRDVKIPKQKLGRLYSPLPKDYIQRVSRRCPRIFARGHVSNGGVQAWSSAVREDVTYMVFNCGSHERIGIRDRTSQTLFLSGLIDTMHANPTYGRTQLGLILATIQDAIDRRKLREEFDIKFDASLKRHAEMEFDIDEDAPPLKRRRAGDSTFKLNLANSINTYHISPVRSN